MTVTELIEQQGNRLRDMRDDARYTADNIADEALDALYDDLSQHTDDGFDWYRAPILVEIITSSTGQAFQKAFNEKVMITINELNQEVINSLGKSYAFNTENAVAQVAKEIAQLQKSVAPRLAQAIEKAKPGKISKALFSSSDINEEYEQNGTKIRREIGNLRQDFKKEWTLLARELLHVVRVPYNDWIQKLPEETERRKPPKPTHAEPKDS